MKVCTGKPVEELDQICRQFCDPGVLQAQLSEHNLMDQQRLDCIVEMFTSNISSLTTKSQQLQTVSDFAVIAFKWKMLAKIVFQKNIIHYPNQ